MELSNLPYYDFQVDIETTGTTGSRCAMLQLAIVPFDFSLGRISQRVFCENLVMPWSRLWEEPTRDWWAKQDPAVWQRVTENPQPVRDVLYRAQQFVRDVSGALYQPRLWAKPISFEWPFLQSYFAEFDVDNPFHFRDCIDLQSFIRGMRNNPGAPAFDYEVPMIGDAHYALDDCYHQTAVALTAKQKFGAPPHGYAQDHGHVARLPDAGSGSDQDPVAGPDAGGGEAAGAEG